MKTIIRCLVAACLTLTIGSQQTSATTVHKPAGSIVETSRESNELKAAALRARLDAINTMDKSKLDRCEKKELRHEVLSIKKQLRDISGGVYISAGALIVILILLIILT